MMKTIEALIDENGTVRLLEPIHLPSARRALVTILEESDGDKNGTSRLTLEEFDAALDELAAIGADIPPGDESITHSREDIYFDHD